MKIYFVVLWISFLSLKGFAETSVWQVSNGKTQLYLGGTVHMLADSDYPLPAAFDLAYKQASKIIMETDISALATPESQQKMRQVIMFDDDRTLRSVLSQETYAKLKKYFLSRSLPESQFQKFNPVGLSLTISILEMQLLGMKQENGVESYYLNKSNADKKQLEYLESLDEQMAFIGSLAVVPPDHLVSHSLEEIKTLSTILKKLKTAWRSGDLPALEAMGIDPFIKEYPEVYAVILKNRNDRWITKIEKMLDDKTIEFVLVGSLHFAGTDGLIKQLREKGYTLKQMK